MTDKTMTIGMVGLGRMGAGLSGRLRAAGHTVVGYDRNPDVSDVASIAEMISKLPSPRVVWMMVPSGEITQTTIEAVASELSSGDIIIDGGNSYVKDTVRRGNELRERGIRFLDAGTSGGIWGQENGFCLMVGGEREAVEFVEPIFAPLAPADGYAHVGGPGAGHFTKMVHNGIEYGMLQAYAEGFDLLHAPPNTNWTSTRSRPSGTTAASYVRGCLNSRRTRSRTMPTSIHSKPTSMTPAKAAGPSSRRSSEESTWECSPSRCSPASPREKTTRSRCGSSRPCGTNSAATR